MFCFYKISTIDVGYGKAPLFASYKTDDDVFFAAQRTASNRLNILIPPLSSVKKRSHNKQFVSSLVENISSDEVELLDSENEYSLVNSKLSHSRQSHRVQKKEKRQSKRKSRTTDGDSERCILHGKRRCTDIDCSSFVETTSTIRRKEKRKKHEERSKGTHASSKSKLHHYSSNSDDDDCLRNREELKFVLNIKHPPNNKLGKSTLSHKLSAIQNQHTIKKEKNHLIKRKRSKSSELASVAVEKPQRKTSKKRKYSHDERDSTQKTDDYLKTNSLNSQPNEDDIYDDEAVSLEEQELRLIALKSAVLKKHEARLKARQIASQQSVRPYSPTDSVMLADEVGDRSNDCIDSDNNNMDISPISSPSGNQCQPMDMDLASSNEDSISPVFGYEKSTFQRPFDQYLDWQSVAVPIPINPFVEIDPLNGLNPPYPIAHPFPLIYDRIDQETKTNFDISIDNSIQYDDETHVTNGNVDNEEDLREQLIRQMRNQNAVSDSVHVESTKTDETLNTISDDIEVDEINQDDSLEEDCLRSLLLSTKGKKSNQIKETSNGSQTVTLVPKLDAEAENSDMPKLALNLKEALKRLKKNQQLANKSIENRSSDSEVTINKTDTNNRLDKNKNEIDANEIEDKDVVRESPNTNLFDANANSPIQTVESLPKETLKRAPTSANATAKKQTSETISTKNGNNNNILTPQIVSKTSKSTVSSNAKQKMEPLPDALSTKPNNQSSLSSLKSLAIAAKNSPKAVTKIDAIPKQIPKTTPTPTTSVSPTIMNLEALRKSTSSPVVPPTWTPKPVKKLIIVLNPDSSSDSELYDSDNNFSDSSMSRKRSTNQLLTVENSTSNSSQSADGNTNVSKNSGDATDAFQLRLDNFLKTVRANTDTGHEKTEVAEPKKSTIVKTTKKVSVNADRKPPVRLFFYFLFHSFKNNLICFSLILSKLASKTESSKAVCHLPISSQLEYHRLINRMKQLEKQKEQKSRSVQPTPSSTIAIQTANQSAEVALPSLTVVVQNENRFIQTNNISTTTESEKISKATTTNVKNIIKITSGNNTLAKQVLVKNTVNSLVSKQTTIAMNQIDTKSIPVKVLSNSGNEALLSPTVPSEHSSSKQPDNDEQSVQSHSTSVSIATLAKKTPKVQASVLANYVKRFRTHR